jgi:hypothetical protein
MGIDRPSSYDSPGDGERRERPRPFDTATDFLPELPDPDQLPGRHDVYAETRAWPPERAADDMATQESADTALLSGWDAIPENARPPLDAMSDSPERARHVLDGDATGGGHRHGTGSPGKTEFPANWDDDKINDAINAVAREPDTVHQQWNGRWNATGEVDQVKLTVIIKPAGDIWTAWPDENSPGVVRNPEGTS